MFAHHPLEAEDRLSSCPLPISFFYGAQDWIKRAGGDVVIAKNPVCIERPNECKVHIIPNSDHHMYWDNPKEFAKAILDDLASSGFIKPSV